MIYLLEDDAGIRELISYTLSGAGLETAGFERPSAFRTAMAQKMPDLAILDIMLPEEDGLHILRSLRANAATARLPVMMLTAKSSEYDKVIGLDGGADDYLTKPFGMMELLARVRALLRRTGETQTVQPLRLGGIELDPSAFHVRVDGTDIPLTRKEFELLRLFLSRPGQVFSRDMLLSRIWGYDYDGESRTVDVHIRSLRQKLGAAGEGIETVRGVGYRMGGEKR